MARWTREALDAENARRRKLRAEQPTAGRPQANPFQQPDHEERTAMFKAYREAHGLHELAELCSRLFLEEDS